MQKNVRIFASSETDGHVTLVNVLMPDQNIDAVGSSKREPGDKHNESIGVDLAIARALEIAARRLHRRANGAIRHAEWVKQQRAAAARKQAGKKSKKKSKKK